MKKLMIGAAIVCAAALAQASSVSWSVVGVPELVGAEAISGYCFLTADNSGGTTYSVDSIVAAIKAGTDPWNDDMMDFVTIANGGGASFGLDGAWGAGDVIHGAIVLFDTDGDPSTAKNYMVVDAGELTNFQATPSQVFNVNASTGSWQSTSPVPEPTSGLLLLIGMASLALKRKRA